MTQPRIVCVCCQAKEVAWHELTCAACRPTLEAAGLLTPAPTAPTTTTNTDAAADKRVQIGPTDV